MNPPPHIPHLAALSSLLQHEPHSHAYTDRPSHQQQQRPPPMRTFRQHMDTARERWRQERIQRTERANAAPSSQHVHTTVVPATAVTPLSFSPSSSSSSSSSSSAPPPRATNLTHARAQNTLSYSGESFQPYPTSQSKPARFYRGWERHMPKRDDEEEEAVWRRNKERGVKPPLQTTTARMVKLKRFDLTGSSTMPTAGAVVGAVSSPFAPPVIRLKAKMQPFFTLPESFQTAASSTYARPPPLLDLDKNEFSQLRLLRDGLEAAQEQTSRAPAGKETLKDYYRGEGSREYSYLFPDSSFLIPRMYQTTHVESYRPFTVDLAVENMLKAKHGSRPQEIDPRAKTNTNVRKIYRSEN